TEVRRQRREFAGHWIRRSRRALAKSRSSSKPNPWRPFDSNHISQCFLIAPRRLAYAGSETPLLIAPIFWSRSAELARIAAFSRRIVHGAAARQRYDFLGRGTSGARSG